MPRTTPGTEPIPAAEAGAAEDRGGKHVEFVTDQGVRDRTRRRGGPDQSGDARHEAEESVCEKMRAGDA